MSFKVTIPNPENSEYRELLTSYALTMWHVQYFESTLKDLVLLDVLVDRSKSNPEIDKLLDRFDKSTLGQAFRRLYTSYSFSEEESSTLNSMIEQRNFLAHHFFTEAPMSTKEERIQTISMLKEMGERFSYQAQQYENSIKIVLECMIKTWGKNIFN